MWYIDREVSKKLRPSISGHFKQNRRVDFFEMAKCRATYGHGLKYKGNVLAEKGSLCNRMSGLEMDTSCSEQCPVTDLVEQKRNVMAHAQKPDLVFQRNGRVHLNRRGCQFSRLLAGEVCASAVVMLDRPCPIQCTTAGYPLHSPFPPLLLLPCVSVCHHIPFLLYYR